MRIITSAALALIAAASIAHAGDFVPEISDDALNGKACMAQCKKACNGSDTEEKAKSCPKGYQQCYLTCFGAAAAVNSAASFHKDQANRAKCDKELREDRKDCSGIKSEPDRIACYDNAKKKHEACLNGFNSKVLDDSDAKHVPGDDKINNAGSPSRSEGDDKAKAIEGD